MRAGDSSRGSGPHTAPREIVGVRRPKGDELRVTGTESPNFLVPISPNFPKALNPPSPALTLLKCVEMLSRAQIHYAIRQRRSGIARFPDIVRD